MFLPGMRRTSLSRILRRSAFVGSFLALLLAAGCGKEQKAAPPPPPAVEVSEVIRKDVPVYTEWVGTTDGLVNATIRAQVTGYLVKQNYREGELVQEGAGALRDRPAHLPGGRGRRPRAALAQAEARWDNGQGEPARIRPLAEKNAVSQKDLDDAIGAELSARAAVEQREGAGGHGAAESGVHQDRLPGGRHRRHRQGPDRRTWSGRGRSEELTTVSTVDPIKVYIPISEQEYLKFRPGTGEQAGRKGSGGHTARTDPGRRQRLSPQGEVLPCADRQVDVKTGTIRGRRRSSPIPATSCAPASTAESGRPCETKKGALLVPQRAVTEVQGKYLVAVVGADNKVDIRPVKAGERVGTLWVIDEGLKPGETGRGRGGPEGQDRGAGSTRTQAAAGKAAATPAKPPRSPPTAKGREEVDPHGQILHQPPHRGHGDLHPHGHHRPGRHVGAAHRPVSQHRPAGDPGQDHLHRRRRAHRRAVGGHAHRAADVRRGQHELHVLHQRQQRADDADGQLRRQDRPQHRPDPGADAPGPGRRRSCPSDVRNYGVTVQKSTAVPADHVRALLAERHLRQHLPRQLRLHQHQRPDDPRARASPASRSSAPASTPCASG